MWAASLLSFLKSPKMLLGVLVIAVTFIAYNKGRSDCAVKHARQGAKDAATWAEKTQASADAAYERGRLAARREASNERTVEEIARDAGMEVGADDLCLSADVVERLRQLR